MFVLGIAAADHFREIQRIDVFKLLCLVLLYSLCYAGLMCEQRNMVNLTYGQWQKFQSYQHRSVLCHMEQAQVLSAYLEICC